jgi:hypothetical protein
MTSALGRLCQVDGAAIKMHLRRGAGVLLGQTHPGVDAKSLFNELRRAQEALRASEQELRKSRDELN